MTEDRQGRSGDSSKILYCSFCGKSQHEVRKLIAGPSVFICDQLADLVLALPAERAVEDLAAVAAAALAVFGHAWLPSSGSGSRISQA